MIQQYVQGVASAQQNGNATLSPSMIEGLICQLQSRFLSAKGEERQRITPEFIRLKEALEDARLGGI